MTCTPLKKETESKRACVLNFSARALLFIYAPNDSSFGAVDLEQLLIATKRQTASHANQVWAEV